MEQMSLKQQPAPAAPAPTEPGPEEYRAWVAALQPGNPVAVVFREGGVDLDVVEYVEEPFVGLHWQRFHRVGSEAGFDVDNSRDYARLAPITPELRTRAMYDELRERIRWAIANERAAEELTDAEAVAIASIIGLPLKVELPDG